MDYYRDINIWKLNGEPLNVTEDNEHLGLVVSGTDEERKNVDKNIESARKMLMSLMGNIFSYKCKLSPIVLHHVWSVFIHPVLRSGLSSLPIRPPIFKPLTRFHHKVLRGILKLSSRSPIPPLYFLLGELPCQAYLHMDILSLFWSVWSNSDTRIYTIVKYLLMMSEQSSLTWAAHLRIICKLYNLPDPLHLMDTVPWPSEKWKSLNKTRILAYYEALWRAKAASNSRITFLNVQLTGLSGRPHAILSSILTTQDVCKSRVHIKMISGDYPCQAHHSSNNPYCPLCKALVPSNPGQSEDIVHILTTCRATTDTRSSLIPTLFNSVAEHFPLNEILKNPTQTQLTQFILDPSSINLPAMTRISPDHPGFAPVLATCRNYCFTIHKERTRQLKQLKV